MKENELGGHVARMKGLRNVGKFIFQIREEKGPLGMDRTPCSVSGMNRRFGVIYCLYLQNIRCHIPEDLNYTTLKSEAKFPPKM
jgi:hypothetical protein